MMLPVFHQIPLLISSVITSCFSVAPILSINISVDQVLSDNYVIDPIRLCGSNYSLASLVHNESSILPPNPAVTPKEAKYDMKEMTTTQCLSQVCLNVQLNVQAFQEK